jgi:hypothetical protein
MAAFNPDAYLAKTTPASVEPAFDPDAYLRSREVPTPENLAASRAEGMPGPRMGFVERFVAPIVEVPAAIATGIPATVAGAITGLVTKGAEGPQAAAKKAEEVAARLTYKPSSRMSQEILGDIGEAIQATKIAPVMPGMGAPGAVRAGARAVMDPVKAETDLVKNALTIASDKRAAAKANQLVEQSFARGPQIDAAKDALRLGIALDPAISNPTKTNRLRAMASDPTELHNILSEANRPKYTSIAKREMGISERTPLTSSKPFDEARAAVAKPYQEIEKIESLAPSTDVVNKISNILEEGLIGSAAAENQVFTLVDDAVAKIQKGMTGKQVLDNISNLRRKAQRVYNSPAAAPDQIDVADARMTIANALEDLVEANITDQKLLKDFRNARVDMAKIYGYERATDMRTGQVDIQKIAKQLEKNPAMTGDIAALGRVAANFPEVTQMKPSELSLLQRFTRAGAAGTVGAGLGGALLGGPGVILGGATSAVASKLGGRYAARRLTTPEVQARRSTPQDFRQLNNLTPAEEANALRGR